jgi:hypothetical protein
MDCGCPIQGTWLMRTRISVEVPGPPRLTFSTGSQFRARGSAPHHEGSVFVGAVTLDLLDRRGGLGLADGICRTIRSSCRVSTSRDLPWLLSGRHSPLDSEHTVGACVQPGRRPRQFIDGQLIPVPADIGINAAAGYLAPIHTHDGDHPRRVARSARLHARRLLRHLGRALRRPMHRRDMRGERPTLSVFVNGQPFAGDPRSLVLAEHQEIAVALGTAAKLPNPVPASYDFPAGL